MCVLQLAGWLAGWCNYKQAGVVVLGGRVGAYRRGTACWRAVRLRGSQAAAEWLLALPLPR